MHVTVKEVARQAGVSPSTVSRVLTGRATVKEEKRQAVLNAAKKLNFRPNALARGLKTQRTQVVALIAPDMSNPYYAQIARGAEDAAWESGFTTIIANSANEARREASYARALLEQRVDGILLAVTGRDYSHVSELVKCVPVVAIGRQLQHDVKTDSVVVNNEEGARRATEHLLRLGHRRIAFLSGDAGVSSNDERLQGYLRALRESEFSEVPPRMISGTFSMDSGRERMKQLFAGGSPPTALVCANDLIALGAIRGLRSIGLRVPRDVAVVGFDDIPMAEFVDPPLTTVGQPAKEMGRTAFQLLLSRLEGRHRRHRRIVLDTQLIVRESCGGKDG